MSGPTDPVLDRRRRMARWATAGRRSGYGLYLLSLAVFMAGVLTGFNDTLASTATVALVAGSVLLAPAIIIGYGVRAADRADRNDDW